MKIDQAQYRGMLTTIADQLEHIRAYDCHEPDDEVAVYDVPYPEDILDDLLHDLGVEVEGIIE